MFTDLFCEWCSPFHTENCKPCQEDRPIVLKNQVLYAYSTQNQILLGSTYQAVILEAQNIVDDWKTTDAKNWVVPDTGRYQITFQGTVNPGSSFTSQPFSMRMTLNGSEIPGTETSEIPVSVNNIQNLSRTFFIDMKKNDMIQLQVGSFATSTGASLIPLDGVPGSAGHPASASLAISKISCVE